MKYFIFKVNLPQNNNKGFNNNIKNIDNNDSITNNENILDNNTSLFHSYLYNYYFTYFNNKKL